MRGEANNKPIYISGQRYAKVLYAYRAALAQGLSISMPAFIKRLKVAGDNPSWSDLLSPVSAQRRSNGVKAGAIRKERCAKQREEMAAMCAELDARKAALKDAA